MTVVEGRLLETSLQRDGALGLRPPRADFRRPVHLRPPSYPRCREPRSGAGAERARVQPSAHDHALLPAVHGSCPVLTATRRLERLPVGHGARRRRGPPRRPTPAPSARSRPPRRAVSGGGVDALLADAHARILRVAPSRNSMGSSPAASLVVDIRPVASDATRCSCRARSSWSATCSDGGLDPTGDQRRQSCVGPSSRSWSSAPKASPRAWRRRRSSTWGYATPAT